MDLFWCHEWLWAGAVCVKDCFFLFLFSFFLIWFQASAVFLSFQHSLEVSTEIYHLAVQPPWWDVMWAPFLFLQHVWPRGTSHLRWCMNDMNVVSKLGGCCWRKCCCSLSVSHPSIHPCGQKFNRFIHSFIHPSRIIQLLIQPSIY